MSHLQIDQLVKTVLWIIVVMLAASALPVLAASMGADDARHLLNRAGFGARPADLAEFAQLSLVAAIERLLADTHADAGPPAPAELTDYISPARMRALTDEGRIDAREVLLDPVAQLK